MSDYIHICLSGEHWITMAPKDVSKIITKIKNKEVTAISSNEISSEERRRIEEEGIKLLPVEMKTGKKILRIV